jgi:hypothetical protein
MIGRFTKDPSAVLDYAIDWSHWLGTDTIATSAWTITASGPLPLEKVRDTHTTTVATVWLSGGCAGGRYKATNRITTAGGRTEDRTIELFVEER